MRKSVLGSEVDIILTLHAPIGSWYGSVWGWLSLGPPWVFLILLYYSTRANQCSPQVLTRKSVLNSKQSDIISDLATWLYRKLILTNLKWATRGTAVSSLLIVVFLVLMFIPGADEKVGTLFGVWQWYHFWLACCVLCQEVDTDQFEVGYPWDRRELFSSFVISRD